MSGHGAGCLISEWIVRGEVDVHFFTPPAHALEHSSRPRWIMKQVLLDMDIHINNNCIGQ